MFDTNFKSILELIKTFSTEQKCINYLEQLRWNGNVISPFDPTSKVYKCKDNKYRCRNTGKYFNVKTKTLFDNTKISLKKWFLAIWLVTSHKKGISSIQLSKEIGVTQKTAWFILHRIRKCFGIENTIEKKKQMINYKKRNFYNSIMKKIDPEYTEDYAYRYNLFSERWVYEDYDYDENMKYNFDEDGNLISIEPENDDEDEDEENNMKLNGTIEADETFIGGKNKNRHKDKKVESSQGRSFKDKSPVAGLLQREKSKLITRNHKIIPGKKVIDKIIMEPGKIIAKVLTDTKSKSLQPFILKHIEKNVLFISDEWHGYKECGEYCNHKFIDHSKKQYVDLNNPNIHTNNIEGAWKILKNRVRDTYNHVSKKHLQKYVDEFVILFNTKNQEISDIFNNFLYNLIECRLTYKELINGKK